MATRDTASKKRGRLPKVATNAALPDPKKASTKNGSTSDAVVGFEEKLWQMADKLRNNMDAAEYKHVVLGLIFLKYISDAFEERHAALTADEKSGVDPEDPDEYRADNIFWVPKEARWSHLQGKATQPTIGTLVDDAMVPIERDNSTLEGVLPKDYGRPALDKTRLGELINLVGTIGLGDRENRARDVLGRVYEYFLTKFASAEGKNGGQFYTPRGVVRVLVEMLAPYKGRVFDPACGSGGMFISREKFVEAHGGRVGEPICAPDADRLLVDLPNKIRDTLGLVVPVRAVTKKGKALVEIEVPPSPPLISYKGEYHFRSGTTKQQFTGNALSTFLLRKLGRHWDGAAVPNVVAKDLSAEAFKRFKAHAKGGRRLPPGALAATRADLIEQLRLADGKLPKRAGLLMFHEDPERWVTGAYVKIGMFRGGADLAYHDEVHGDLFTQLDKTIELLLTKYMVAWISYRGVTRHETYPIPEDALREALLNALIHKDYSSGNPIQSRVETDSLSIWNARPLPPSWTAPTLLERHTSQPPNPDIASTFFRTGLIEAWGRGYERIAEACREQGTPEPTVESDRNGVWVKWAWVNPTSDADRVRPRTEEPTQVAGQVPGQVDRLLAAMKDEMPRDAMQAALGLAGRANFIVQYLKPALEAGLIEMTIPDKPKSRLQKYRLTRAGKAPRQILGGTEMTAFTESVVEEAALDGILGYAPVRVVDFDVPESIGMNDKGEAVGAQDAGRLLVDLPNKIRDTLGLVVPARELTKQSKTLVQIDVAPSLPPISYTGECDCRLGSTEQQLTLHAKGGKRVPPGARTEFIEKLRLTEQTTDLGHVTAGDMQRLSVVKPDARVLAAWDLGGKTRIKAKRLVKPDARVLAAWDRVAAPSFASAFQNELEVVCLAHLRDEVLRRLLSGELPVGQAERSVEEVA